MLSWYGVGRLRVVVSGKELGSGQLEVVYALLITSTVAHEAGKQPGPVCLGITNIRSRGNNAPAHSCSGTQPAFEALPQPYYISPSAIAS